MAEGEWAVTNHPRLASTFPIAGLLAPLVACAAFFAILFAQHLIGSANIHHSGGSVLLLLFGALAVAISWLVGLVFIAIAVQRLRFDRTSRSLRNVGATVVAIVYSISVAFHVAHVFRKENDRRQETPFQLPPELQPRQTP